MANVDIYSIPHYYDILHTPGTATEVAGLAQIQDRFVGSVEEPVWLEPACGSGRYLRAAAKRGVRTVGFDLSEPMVKYAIEQAKQEGVAELSRYFVADMRDFTEGRRLPKAHFAFNTINTIRHVASDAAMLGHFACVARSLAPGGVYAVGLSMCSYGREPATEDVWHGTRAGTTVSQLINYIPAFGRNGNAARVERVISHLTVTTRGVEEHIDSSYGLRSYDVAQWRELLGKSELEIVATVDEHGVDTMEPEVGYIIYILRPRTVTRRPRPSDRDRR
ncbi:MAG: class I SAM-dependent methyltransferase [Phycisphaerales bacterium]